MSNTEVKKLGYFIAFFIALKTFFADFGILTMINLFIFSQEFSEKLSTLEHLHSITITTLWVTGFINIIYFIYLAFKVKNYKRHILRLKPHEEIKLMLENKLNID